MTDMDWAWAAGIIEGEGSIRISKPTRRNAGALMVAITNTEQDMIVSFHERFGGYCKPGKIANRPNARMYWRWTIAARQAERFLLGIQPHLRTEKYRIKTELALRFQQQKARGGRPPGDENGSYFARQVAFYDEMRALTDMYRGAATNCAA